MSWIAYKEHNGGTALKSVGFLLVEVLTTSDGNNEELVRVTDHHGLKLLLKADNLFISTVRGQALQYTAEEYIAELKHAIMSGKSFDFSYSQETKNDTKE